jgi:uncharacterized membrane protein YbhN (UPF0104 family)
LSDLQHRGLEEMPRIRVTRRQAVAFGVFVLSVVAFLYFVLPQISGVGDTVNRIEKGDTWWVAIGVLLEVCSFAGYVVLFRAVFTREHGVIGWRESYLITMAGLAATRLFAAAGAGGVALTAWALRRAGMKPRLVATRMVAFMALLYAIYLTVLVLDGLGLGIGLLPGGSSFALTFLPALLGGLLLALACSMMLLPGDLDRRYAGWAGGAGRRSRLVASVLAAPATLASGMRGAIGLLRTRDPRLLGAPAWWGFDVCVLWASFKAFGHAPGFFVILMAYFLGTLGNLLPLPGGLGGVEGGMIGAFAAFGVEFNLAVLAVLTYRGIAFWLPTVPGAIAYFQLRRTVARWREGQEGTLHADAEMLAADAGALGA